mgnify:FL=1
MTVKELETRVVEDIKCHFTIKAQPEEVLSNLIQKKFEIEVNRNKFTVMPNLLSMIPTTNKKEL